MIKLKPELEAVLNLNSLPPLVVTNASGKIQFFNQPAHQKFKDYSAQELKKDQLIYELFEQNAATELELALAQTSQNVTSRLTLQVIDRPEIRIEIVCEPYRQSDSEINGASLTVNQIIQTEGEPCPKANSSSFKSKGFESKTSELFAANNSHKTEKYLQAILNNLPMGILVVNPEGIITLAKGNDQLRERYKLDEVVGKPIRAIRANRPDLLDNWSQALEGKTFSQKTITSQEEIFQDFYSPLYKPDGELEGALAVSINITEQSQTQAQLQVQNKYLEALTQVNLQMINQLDSAKILQTITYAAASILNVDRCAIFLLNETKTALVERAGYGTNPANLGMEFQRGEGMAGRVWETGQVVNLAEYYSLNQIPDKLNPNNHPARAAIGLPLKRQEEFIGVLTLSYADPVRRFGPDEIKLLERLAMFAVLTLENARLYATAQNELAQRKATEIALRNSEAQLRSFIDNVPQRCYLIDRDYNLQLFNRLAAEVHVKYWNDEPLTVGRSCHEIRSPLFQNHLYDLFLRTQKGESIVTEVEQQDENGDVLWWEVRCSPVVEQDHTISGACVVIANITERKQAEDNLRQSESRLRAAVNSVPETFYLLDREYRIELFNQQAYQTVQNVRKINLTEGYPFPDLLDPQTREEFLKASQHVLTGKPISIEKKDYSANGVEFWMEIRYNPVIEADGTTSGVCITMLNITERKRTEQALQTTESRLRVTLDNIQQRFYLIDRDYRLQLFNRLAYEHYRRDRGQELVVGRPFDEYVQPANQEKFVDYFRRALQGENFRVEISRTLADGTITWWESWFSPAREKDGTISGVCYAAIDINDRKTADNQLKASLAEKEILLKEIHHRVKNNLQIISSLLRLQTSVVQEPATLVALKDSQQRIRSMALIHEKLYQSEKLSQVDFGDYIRSLVAQLFRSYQSGGRVQLELNIPDGFWLKLDQAIPCGLIINELVSNSLKYAFPATFQGNPKISISLESFSNDQDLRLQVWDNGIGLPPEFDLTKLESLGLQLVEMLSQQLNGDCEIGTGSQGGTYFSLNFTI